MTDAEFAVVRAYAVAISTGGQISALSGGAKSSSYALMDTADFLIEFRAEVQRRAGTVVPNHIEQRLFPRGDITGTISIP